MLKKLVSKCLKYILIASGILLLTARVMPNALTAWQPFAAVSWLGIGVVIVYGIFAIIASLIPVFQKRKQPAQAGAKGTFILHDLAPEQASQLFSNLKNTKIFCAANKMAHCKGGYDCWLKHPGICALRDSAETLGREIAQSETLIIISKSLYGGFSRETKTALDRSISFVLPFFHVRNKELHHQTRYNFSGTMRVYIYNAGTLSETEQSTIREMVKAVGMNMDRLGCETIFVNDATELSGVPA